MEITKKELKDFNSRKFPDEICFKPIGVIHSQYKSLKGIPIQSSMSETEGILEIFKKYQEGLKDLEGFSYLFCIFYFDMVKLPVPMQSKPFLEDEERGVFAIRTPFRPNPIGLSILKIEGIKDNKIHVSQVDILDNTPILDIKPYAPQFDSRNTDRIGWLQNRIRKMTS